MKNENLLYETAWTDKKTGKVYRKPKKFLIYVPEIQEKIYQGAKKAVVKEIKKCNSRKGSGKILKAVAFGSSVEKEIGMYYEKYQDIRYGSDVDLLVHVGEGFKPPKRWKLNAERSHSTEYNVDRVEKYVLEVKKMGGIPVHPINFLIHLPEKHDVAAAKQRLPVDFAASKKKGFPVEVWFGGKK